MQNSVPEVAQEAVLVQSGQLPVEPIEVKGYDFNLGIDYHKLLQSFRTSGFQATNFGLAVEEINKMVCEYRVIDVSFIIQWWIHVFSEKRTSPKEGHQPIILPKFPKTAWKQECIPVGCVPPAC